MMIKTSYIPLQLPRKCLIFCITRGENFSRKEQIAVVKHTVELDEYSKLTFPQQLYLSFIIHLKSNRFL